MSERKYQFFVSSTYLDMVKERSVVFNQILKTNNIPLAMELFVATDLTQIEVIKKTILMADYYILIIGERYGSVDEDSKLSYTEFEYKFALENEVPILAFIKNVDTNDANLEKFKKTVMKNRQVKVYNTLEELESSIVISITNEIASNPRRGLVPANTFDNSELLEQINTIRLKNDKLTEELDKLKKEHKELIKQSKAWTYDFDQILVKDSEILLKVRVDQQKMFGFLDSKPQYEELKLKWIDAFIYIARILREQSLSRDDIVNELFGMIPRTYRMCQRTNDQIDLFTTFKHQLEIFKLIEYFKPNGVEDGNKSLTRLTSIGNRLYEEQTIYKKVIS